MGQKISTSVTTSQWYLYGRHQFTQTGYRRHIEGYTAPVQESAAIPLGAPGSDGVNLSGKVVIISGANSGLGKEMATYAAAKGANLYMLCRSKERADRARTEILEATGASKDNVKVLLADVGELSQVREAVKKLKSMEDKVDVLVCNAGVLLNERRETSEGNEVTFAAHFLGGSYLLSNLLLTHLKAAGNESRVVFVTSGGMYLSPFPKWEVANNSKDSGEEYNGTKAYTYAKRGQVLLSEQMAKAEPSISFVVGHPGWSRTAAVGDAFGDDAKYLEPMRTTWEGAEGLTWLMSAPRDDLKSGSFYLDRAVQQKHLSGPFMTEGSATKNTSSEVEDMMERLQKAAGL